MTSSLDFLRNDTCSAILGNVKNLSKHAVSLDWFAKGFAGHNSDDAAYLNESNIPYANIHVSTTWVVVIWESSEESSPDGIHVSGQIGKSLFFLGSNQIGDLRY